MSRGNFNIPYPVNEPVLSYAPGTAEREEVLRVYREMYSQAPVDVPMYIGKDAVRTDDKRTMSPPHDHQHILGHFNYGDASHVNAAIDAALAARPPTLSRRPLASAAGRRAAAAHRAPRPVLSLIHI